MTSNESNSNQDVMSQRNLLTFNSHEAYVYGLAQINEQWHVIDQLPGRYTLSWDKRIRPVPDNVKLITLQEALSGSQQYDCAIAHSISDLLLIKSLKIPKILVIHNSLTGYIAQEGHQISAEDTRSVLNQYIKLIQGVVVSVSEMKQKTWGVSGPIIPGYVDGHLFNGFEGNEACGLRVGNQLRNKSKMLKWDFFNSVSKGFPVKIVGYNPDIPDSVMPADFFNLREHYRRHRFYLHTAQYDLEDGYNLASLEAMATGMPVICNEHPTAPVMSGVNGFMSDDIDELRGWIEMLLLDRDMARKLGAAARETALEHFPLTKFRSSWEEVIESVITQFMS